MFILISICSLLLSVESFLVDKPPNVGGQPVLSGQYLTVTTYFEDKKLQQQETLRQRQDTDKLRHDTDQKLALLASQLQQKFDNLEQTLVDERKLNKTKEDLLLLEQKYHTLEQNHKYLNQEHSTLLKKYSVLENEIIAITNKTKHAEEKDIYQESFNNGIDMRIQMQVEELNTIKNKSLEVEKEVLSLKQLASIKPLNAINVIQQTVNTLASQTNSLRVNEQARSQDFLALFNMTVDTKKTLAEFSKNVNSQIQELGYNQSVSLVAIEHNMTSELYAFRIIQNKTLVDIKSMVRDAENRSNGTLASLQNQISQSVEKVAMTAIVSTDVTLSAGSIVKFPDVRFSKGMGDLSTFKSTGEFKCGKSGLYIVSVTIEFNYNGSEFYIYVNGSVLTKNTKNQQSQWWQSSLAVTAIELNMNDIVWVQIGIHSTSVRANFHSHLTIIKIH
ncbi:chromosome partition protein Smc-like [Mytilus edulis]|uniref:chromosome partition protein Smc-like n=1 Tax=Mytilus edulis TaxID=6550 RepID=UPI0039EFC849